MNSLEDLSEVAAAEDTVEDATTVADETEIEEAAATGTEQDGTRLYFQTLPV